MTDFYVSSLSKENERTLQYVNEFIDQQRSNTLNHTEILSQDSNLTSLLPSYQSIHIGKVRDMIICDKIIIIITTDRQSAFDRQLTNVPCKGQVLNLVSLWWFDQTKNIIPNAIIASPHPNITIAKKCKVFPVEFVMRGYITGSTSTSLWTNYNKGIRKYCGHIFPDGLQKNQRLDVNKLTPTTKSDLHDELISAEEIIDKGIMTQEHWEVCASYAHQLFHFGQQEALKRGLLLVDTKYEFGIDDEGVVRVIDEVHTPDSSRYWVAETYHDKMLAGLEPDNIDKEFLRKWYASRCDPYDLAATLPEAPAELINELSRRYILIYEILTDSLFPRYTESGDLLQSIKNALIKYFSTSTL